MELLILFVILFIFLNNSNNSNNNNNYNSDRLYHPVLFDSENEIKGKTKFVIVNKGEDQ